MQKNLRRVKLYLDDDAFETLALMSEELGKSLSITLNTLLNNYKKTNQQDGKDNECNGQR